MRELWRAIIILAVFWAVGATSFLVLTAPTVADINIEVAKSVNDSLASHGYIGDDLYMPVPDRAESIQQANTHAVLVGFGPALLTILVALYFMNRIKRAELDAQRHRELLAANKPPVTTIPPDAMRTQFAQIKTLIVAREYDQARSLLWNLDHPLATQWIARLDALQGAKH
jgi:hypothetical protein